jgi:hypothetical protein
VSGAPKFSKTEGEQYLKQIQEIDHSRSKTETLDIQEERLRELGYLE